MHAKEPRYSLHAELELWRAFKAGSDQAYELIYQRHARELFNYGYCLAHNRHTVEDCVHDLFVYIYQHRSSLGDTDSIKYYLFKALRRRIMDVLQQRNRRDAIDELIRKITAEPEFSAEAKWIETESVQHQNKHLTEAMAQLPKRQREILFLIYYSNLSYAEVSDMMSLKVRTIYNQVHTALQTLRSHIPKLEPYHVYGIAYFMLG